VSGADRHASSAVLFGAAFALILTAAMTLAFASVSDGNDTSAPLVALVASVGGLFLLWIGVVRRSRTERPGA